jgi:hypothetical protein
VLIRDQKKKFFSESFFFVSNDMCEKKEILIALQLKIKQLQDLSTSVFLNYRNVFRHWDLYSLSYRDFSFKMSKKSHGHE